MNPAAIVSGDHGSCHTTEAVMPTVSAVYSAPIVAIETPESLHRERIRGLADEGRADQHLAEEPRGDDGESSTCGTPRNAPGIASPTRMTAPIETTPTTLIVKSGDTPGPT